VIRAAAAAVSLAALALSASPARADHTREQHITDEMPYTLRPGEWRIGLWKVEAGLPLPRPLGPAQIGTYTLPYLAWLVDLETANLYAKATVWDRGRWSATLGAGLVYARLTADENDARFTITPVEAYLGHRFGKRLTLAGGLLYTNVEVDGAYAPDEDDLLLRGTAAVSNLQLPVTLEWRWSRVTALVVQGRLLAFQDTGGRGNGEYMIDPATKVTVVASGETDALEPLRSFALTTDFVWSWSHVNLRAGVTYGNVSLPMLNFVSPVKTVLPNIDFFVRF
jgi:hypothetical protein